MKNVTITLDEETARWARIEAARRDTSVSRLIGELLKGYMATEQGYESAKDDFFSRPIHPLKKRAAKYPRRSDLYDRDRLR